MIILHAGETESGLLLWGEKSAEEVRPSASPGPKPKVIPPAPYPFDAGADGLFEALKEASIGFKPAKGNAKKVIVWLPTRGSKATASSALIAEPPRSRAKTKLSAWAVTAYQLSIEQTGEFHCR